MSAVIESMPYRDRKRATWLLSMAVPLLAAAGPLLYLASAAAWTLWLPVLLVYIGLPIADLLVGEDRSNPPESAMAGLDADRYYRMIAWMMVPLLWVAFVFAAWFVMRHDLPLHGLIAATIATGVVGGFCINIGHELGHKRGAFERWLAKLVLAPTGYGHFHVEHNRGHHRDVATPDDPASSRMGESIYAFVVREIPGAWRRAWRLERERMQGLGRSRFSLHNDIVQTSLITLALWTTLIAWLGIGVLPFLIAASFWANFQLTSANYIEHYGIARKRLPNGRYEPCKPEHSWNSNHLVSNWALFHLQRHSDHHANATRRYQCLRHFDEAPQLPTGYFGMFLLSYVPPLWFRVMDPRLLAMVGRDPERINAQPSQRQHLFARHGLAAPP
ncbi:MAG: alkane 1-monooxygenase [Rhodanobacteraceae bacterium]|nr:alkane 1-monooxygenase [Rhodanobacteraceae bacterium]MBL0039842.1 alkane 1-monooxygenase [Xanthomonadales bacterium]MBP6077742.1 alkane 1-monooxygenase [Xanthomonadales bacterium]MBP7622346.1 alkane 1-monooxygenase [Xanthomonadales bacterium]